MEAPKQIDAAAVETSPTIGAPSWASRLVGVVITALVYGALVYISRFAPHLFGMQLIYPAVSVGPAFGVWFQFWGGLGLILGTIISQLPAGLNPLVWVPANLAQGLYAILPAIFYRKATIDSRTDWLRYAGICLVTNIIVLLFLIWNLDINKYVPFAVGIRTLFPINLIVNLVWILVVGPVIMNSVSPYVIKAGLRFRRFF